MEARFLESVCCPYCTKGLAMGFLASLPLRPIYNVMVMKLGVQKSKEQFGCDDRRNVD